MAEKRGLTKFVAFLLVLDLIFLLYFASFNYFMFNEDYYKKEFTKYGVYENLKEYDIEKINSDVLSYLKNKDQELTDNNFFKEREIEHLKDVKVHIQNLIWLFYFTLIAFFILLGILIFIVVEPKKILKKLGHVFLIGGILGIIDTFVFWILVYLDFSFVFDSMHEIFFKAGTYVFDPTMENIVNLYPYQFFNDITTSIVLTTLYVSIALFIIGIVLVKTQKD